MCTPGRPARWCRARWDSTGPTPASTRHRSSSPSSPAASTQRAKAGTSNTYWVCTNCAPASTLAASRPMSAAGSATAAEQPGRPGHELAPGHQLAVVAHHPGHPEQLSAVQVEDRLGLRVVALPGIVAGHQHHVRDAQRRGGQQLGLQRDPVPVPAGQLHDGLDPGVQRGQAAGPARHPGRGARVVGDVHRVHPVPQQPPPCGSTGSVLAPRGGPTSAVTANSPAARTRASTPGPEPWPPGLPAMGRSRSRPPVAVRSEPVRSVPATLRLLVGDLRADLAADHAERAQAGQRGGHLARQRRRRRGGLGQPDGRHPGQHGRVRSPTAAMT